MISIVVVVGGGDGGDGGGGFVYIRQRGEASERGEGGSSARVAPLNLISFRRSQGIPSANGEKVSFCKERKSGQVQP
jgi:hypothetical protein